MGSINKKFKKNKEIKFSLSTRFVCKKCNFEKVIPREVIQSLDPNDFSYNKIFICPNCNIRMTPVSFEADF